MNFKPQEKPAEMFTLQCKNLIQHPSALPEALLFFLSSETSVGPSAQYI